MTKFRDGFEEIPLRNDSTKQGFKVSDEETCSHKTKKDEDFDVEVQKLQGSKTDEKELGESNHELDSRSDTATEQREHNSSCDGRQNENPSDVSEKSGEVSGETPAVFLGKSNDAQGSVSENRDDENVTEVFQKSDEVKADEVETIENSTVLSAKGLEEKGIENVAVVQDASETELPCDVIIASTPDQKVELELGKNEQSGKDNPAFESG